jgi:acetolactate synthase-1/2/3 large subunit
MATAARIIARRLAAAGCRYAFGMPGGEVVTLIDALAEAGLRFVLSRHENGAGFMAEGTWHATGAPAVLVTTLGPGLANAANVIANAQQDRVPLVVLSGCVDPEVAAVYTHQVFDHGAMLRPIVKGSFALVDGAVDLVVTRALDLALEGRPGPVHIDLPVSLADRDQPDRPVITAVHRSGDVSVGAARTAFATALGTSARPLMVLGLDAVAHGAGATAADLARRIGMPVITTYKAKGLFPEDDPLSLGAAGLSPLAERHLLPVVRRADPVLLVGYDPIEMRMGWYEPFAPEAAILELCAAPIPHGMHRPTHRLVGDVGRILAALAEDLPARPAWPDREPAAARAALASAFASPGAWGPHAVFETLRAALPDDAVVTVDSGAHRILMSQMWHARGPRRLLQSTGFCTMACALPLAIGYKLARPETPVVAVMGDGGFDMIMGEMATLRDLGLPLVVVVLADRSLALIELKQRAAGLDRCGVAMGCTDYPALAAALGGRGVVAGDRAGLSAAVRTGLARPAGFTLVACPIAAGDYEGRI